MKSRIIEELGEGGILLPALVGEGLAANDRIKLRLSVLQAAAARAEQPGRAAVDLEAECRAAGVPAAAMTALINGAHLNAAGSIEATNLGALLADIAGDADTMIHAVAAGDAAAGAAMTKRFEAIVAEGALAPTDSLIVSRTVRGGLSGSPCFSAFTRSELSLSPGFPNGRTC